jgi:glycerophosphoryl diester phosphodiesterase
VTRYIKSGTVNTVQEINSELERIATSQVEFLARNGETPNAMDSNIDMNSHTLLNLASPISLNSPIRLLDLQAAILGVDPLEVPVLPVVLKETLTLSSGQAIVQFSSALISNASVHISGTGADNTRLHEVLDYTPRTDISDTTLQLLTTYPTGSLITIYSYGLNTAVATPNTESAKIEIIAHRGFRDSYPQNTMLAFTSAIRRGADSLECDVQITSDGIPVVFHDTTVNALTNGSGTIASLTLAQVQALIIDEVAGTAFSGARIPTFAEFLRYTKQAGIKVYAEVKQYRTQSDIALMIQDVIDADMELLTFFSSFNFSDVQVFKGINNLIPCGLLGSSADSNVYEPAIDALALLGNTGIVWDYPALLSNENIVLYARSKGLDVQAYTVNDNTAAKDLMRIGVTKIITDIKLEVL